MYEIIQFLSRDDILLAGFLIFTFVSVFIFIYNILPNPQSIMAIRRLGMEDELTRESKIFMIRMLRPFFNIFLGAIVKFRLGDYRKETKKKLITANLSGELTPDEFIAFKIATMLLFPPLAILFTTALEIVLPTILIPLLAVLGYFYPDLWMKQRINARKKEILVHLPYTIDILTLSVEAGLDFIAALSRLMEKTKPNALLDELTQVLREIRLGTARSDALRNMADRLQIEEISSLVTLLIQVDQFGADIGTVLRAQSDQIRANRFYAAEQAGAKASQLILFPMILFIFPTIFLVILGPYFILYSTGRLL